ncbi:MAG: hypothetical protein FJ170_06765 [Gammaproteobacteria bacterium]|nr:hypothetical protein [Alphaproteobacteria bacterium]MBM4221629.1 hypothetical protein [Gammaproteobacteria bacterium]
MRRIIDITVAVSPQLPSWPGEPKLTASLLRDMSRGDSCTVSRIEGGVHTGMIKGLDLRPAAPVAYDLYCLPLKLAGIWTATISMLARLDLRL